MPLRRAPVSLHSPDESGHRHDARERFDRVGRPDLPFVICALVCGAVVLYLGRSLTFWYDEWRSITFDGGVLDYLRPVNEHWLTLPLLLYRATFSVVELHSYLPYLAQVVVLHLVAVAGVYVLMRRRIGPMAATVLALPLLVLGAGAENLFWAFQTAFVGSAAFGVWALVLVETGRRRSAVAASALLIGSLMCSGIGLSFLFAVAVRTIVDWGPRLGAIAAGAPAVAYVAWHLVFGRDAVGDEGGLAGPISVAWFAVRGVGYSLEVMTGLDRLPTGRLVGVAAVVCLGAIALLRTRGGRHQGLAIGCLVGLVSMYALVGVARAELEPDYSTRSRYVYIAAFFVILTVADLLTGRDLAGLARGRRGAVLATTAVLLIAWVIAVGVNSLFAVRTQFQHQADVTRAIIELSIEHEGEPWLDPDGGLDLMPNAAALPALVAKHGSPLEDEYFSSIVPMPSARAYEEARHYLRSDR
jgi:hypothetical protein